MARVSVLRPDEAVLIDPARVVELYARLGEIGAGKVVARAADEIGARIVEMEKLAANGEYRALALSSARLSALAERVGMSSMSRVAGDVLRTSLAGDRHSRASTFARLLRIARRSVTAVGELRRAIS